MPKHRFHGMPKVTLKNINRVETDAHGWSVNVKRRRRSQAKYFADGMDGPFESLRAAIAWRDEVWRAVGPPDYAPMKATRRNTSGVLGVVRETYEAPSGRLMQNYRASWMDEANRRRRCAFSIDVYGEEDAKRMAVEARRKGVAAAAKARRVRLLDVLHTHKQLVGDLRPPPGAPPRAR